MATSSRAAQKAAQDVADKLSKREESNTAPKVDLTAFDGHQGIRGDQKLTGLPELTPQGVMGQMPKFDPNSYSIQDPLHPPASLPQVTEAEHANGMAIYAGAGRALDLTGAAMDTASKKFQVLGKMGKAISSGIGAATSLEKIKSDLITYAIQTENTVQKGFALDTARQRTSTESAKVGLNQLLLQEELQQLKSQAEMSKLKSQESLVRLQAYQKQLGEVQQ